MILHLSFFCADLDEVCRMANQVMVPVRRPEECAWTQTGPLPNVQTVESWLPGPNKAPSGAFLSLAVDTRWTMLMSRGGDGWYSMANAIAKQAPHIDVVIIRESDRTEQYQKRSFELLRMGRSIRSVAVWMEEDGWRYLSRGDLLPEEDVSFYSPRSKRDRFTPAHLHLLLNRLGIPYPELLRSGVRDARLLTT